MLNNTLKTLYKMTSSSINGSLIIKNALEALQNSEKETNIVEMGYTQQKGIGAKPTLLSTGEVLKSFNLPLKLHYTFCNPQKIIDELEQMVLNRETFLYFQGDRFVGRFVVNKTETNTISRIGGNIVCAELTVSLLEAPFEDDEVFKQQKKEKKQPSGNIETVKPVIQTPVKLKNITDKIPDSIKVRGLGYLDGKTSGLASKALNSDSLLNLALRECKSYLNEKTNGISDEILNLKGELDELID